jgi:hypothetical protein
LLAFPTAEFRQRAVTLAAVNYFKISKQWENSTDCRKRFHLRLSREGIPEQAMINEQVFYLIDLAGPLQGSYQGWETQVIEK